jgi:hypothetical protein
MLALLPEEVLRLVCEELWVRAREANKAFPLSEAPPAGAQLQKQHKKQQTMSAAPPQRTAAQEEEEEEEEAFLRERAHAANQGHAQQEQDDTQRRREDIRIALEQLAEEDELERQRRQADRRRRAQHTWARDISLRALYPVPRPVVLELVLGSCNAVVQNMEQELEKPDGEQQPMYTLEVHAFEQREAARAVATAGLVCAALRFMGGVVDFDGFRANLVDRGQREAFLATFGGRRVPLGGEWPPHPFHRKTGNPEMEKLLFYYDFGCTVALNAHNLSKRDIGLTSSQRRQRARERRASHGVGLGRGRPDDEDVDDDSAYDSMSDGEAHDRPTITHEMVYEGVSRVIAQMKDMSLPACDAGHFNQVMPLEHPSLLKQTVEYVLCKKIIQPCLAEELTIGLFGHNQKGRPRQVEIYDFINKHAQREWMALALMQPYQGGRLHLYRHATSIPRQYDSSRLWANARVRQPVEIIKLGSMEGGTVRYRQSHRKRKALMEQHAWHLDDQFSGSYWLLQAVMGGQRRLKWRDLGYIHCTHVAEVIMYTSFFHAMKSIISNELPALKRSEAKPRYIPQAPFEFAAQITAVIKGVQWVRYQWPLYVAGGLRADNEGPDPLADELAWNLGTAGSHNATETQHDSWELPRGKRCKKVGGPCERIEVKVVQDDAATLGIEHLDTWQQLRCLEQFHEWVPLLVASYRFEMLAIEPAESIDLQRPDLISDEVEQRAELLQQAVAAVFHNHRQPTMVELAELQCEVSSLRGKLFVSRPEDQDAIEAYKELRKLQQEAEQRRSREQASREEGRRWEEEQVRRAWEQAREAADEALARQMEAEENARDAQEAEQEALRAREQAAAHDAAARLAEWEAEARERCAARVAAAEEHARLRLEAEEAQRQCDEADELRSWAESSARGNLMTYGEAIDLWFKKMKGKKQVLPQYLRLMGITPTRRVSSDAAAMRSAMLADTHDRFGLYADLCELYGPFRAEAADGASMDVGGAEDGESASDDGAEQSREEHAQTGSEDEDW